MDHSILYIPEDLDEDERTELIEDEINRAADLVATLAKETQSDALLDIATRLVSVARGTL